MIDINKVNAERDTVIVKMVVDKGALLTEKMSSEESVVVRKGVVVHIGKDVDSDDSCKNLEIGDIVLFTEFAGYYIPTSDSNLHKAMKGYDIIGKMKNDKMEVKDLIPTANRVLVEVDNGTGESLFDDIRDPRVADLSYGKVVAIGDSVKELDINVGDIVAFPPYAGVVVQEHESIDIQEMKTVVEFDILFTVKK